MTGEAFMAALVDSIAPGGRVGHGLALPAASLVGCDRNLAKALADNRALQVLVDSIARQAGGTSAFTRSSAQERHALLEAVQSESPQAFTGLVALTLAHYYAQPQVLSALHWPARPPQPGGHELPAFDDSLLKPVLERGAIWRRC
ncbi:MAG: hypothetical protein JNM20_19340 [Rhizobiales bacterium]|nr:hypothetical protein [Hyphomicrobiales bacterium]